MCHVSCVVQSPEGVISGIVSIGIGAVDWNHVLLGDCTDSGGALSTLPTLCPNHYHP
jgi:hypothetical protein